MIIAIESMVMVIELMVDVNSLVIILGGGSAYANMGIFNVNIVHSSNGIRMMEVIISRRNISLCQVMLSLIGLSIRNVMYGTLHNDFPR